MRLRLIPRNEQFFELFEAAATNVVQGARYLHQMMTHYERAEELQKMIEATEHEGDITTHEIMERLNTTFVTPIDAEDIRDLARTLDDVLDYIEATSDRMILYNVGQPARYMEELVAILEQAAGEIVKAVGGLRDLRRPRRLLDYCIEINRLENEGDRLSRRALAELFASTTDAMAAIKWKEIYEHVEMAIDRCEDIANIVESVVVKYA
jgi:predicted phosphate transport protein (TIGR00153 family)